MNESTKAFFASMATFVGYHYRNGRWVRVVLFSGLMLTLAVTALLVGRWYYLTQIARGTLDYHESRMAIGRMRMFSAIVAVAVAIIWLASAIAAALDARAGTRGETRESPFVRALASGAICSFGIVALAAVAAFWYLAIQIEHGPGEEPIPDATAPNVGAINGESLPISKPKHSPIFYGYLRHGEHCDGCFPDFHRNQLPPGTGRIEGLVRLNGKGVAGVKVHLFLTNNALTQWDISDTDGKYTISIPPGAYGFEGWGIDQASLEAALPGKILARTDQDHRDIPVLVVKTDTPTTGPIFDFADPIVRVKPLGGVDVARNDVLEWKACPGASRYVLSFRKYGTEFPKGGEGTRRWDSPFIAPTFRFVPEAETTATTAPFLPFGILSKKYYSWSIAAYDAAGNCLSQSLGTDQPDFKVK